MKMIKEILNNIFLNKPKVLTSKIFLNKGRRFDHLEIENIIFCLNLNFSCHYRTLSKNFGVSLLEALSLIKFNN